jgi:hypothetical protein
MMMSKPNSEQEKEVEEAPAFAAPAAMKTGTVEDLERRLAMLGKDEGRVATTAAAAAPPTMKDAAPAPPPTIQAPAPAPTAIKGGKNALLVSKNILKNLKKKMILR